MSVDEPREATANGPAKRPRFPWLSAIIVVAGLIWIMGDAFLILPLFLIPALLLAGFCVVYLVAPLKARQTSWMSPSPEVRAIDLDSAGTPPAFVDGSRAIAESLAGLGFVGRGHYCMEKFAPGHSSFVAIFDNRAERTIARWVNIASSKKIEPVLAFATRFADGSEFVTSNNRTPLLTPRAGFRKGFAFPGVEGPSRLLRLHRRGMAELGEFSARVPFIEGDPIAYLLRSVAEEQAHMVESGYYRLERASGLYRQTVKGAYLMAWRHVWPWGTIRRAIRRRQAARRLRAWEATSA